MSQTNSLIDPLNFATLFICLIQNPGLLSLLDNQKNLYNKNKEKDKDITKNYTFQNELYKLSKKVEYVKIQVTSGGNHSAHIGYLTKLHKDFIVLIKKYEKIYIPVDKILSLKIINSPPGKKKKITNRLKKKQLKLPFK
ncbi:MAG: hypothetical protein ACOCQ2_01895 [Halanaerobiales bacterium]